MVICLIPTLLIMATSMVIKRKEFSARWTGVQGRSAITVMEKSKKRVVRGFVSKECAGWIVSCLRKHVEEWKNPVQLEVEEREGKRWCDHLASVQLQVLQNGSGRFC